MARLKLKDQFMTGFVPALLLPLLGFYIYYLLFFGYMTFDGFVDHVVRSNLAVSVLSLGVILNLGLFFLYYVKEIDKAARGVIGATFLYAFVVLYFKILA
ncbi:MAG: hypothetical protein U0Y08_01895 [Bacteroidia bacterium]